LSGLAFALLHSFTATTACKQWCYRHALPERRYRLIYSILATLITIGWLAWIHQLSDHPLYQLTGWPIPLLRAIQIAGGLMVLAAFHPIDSGIFLGLKSPPEGGDPFITCGIYHYLRHPMYAGVALILLAAPNQSVNAVHFGLMVILYFIIGARFEEQRMVAQHPQYQIYRQQTPAFIPKLPVTTQLTP